MHRVRGRRIGQGDCQGLGPGSLSDRKEEDDLTPGLSEKVLAGMPNAQEVQGMLLHTDPTGAAGGHVADGRPERKQPSRVDSIKSINHSDKGMQLHTMVFTRPRQAYALKCRGY
jgi:hypothetical protein